MPAVPIVLMKVGTSKTMQIFWSSDYSKIALPRVPQHKNNKYRSKI